MAHSLKIQKRVYTALEMDSMAIQKSYKVSTRTLKRFLRHFERKINSRIRLASITLRRRDGVRRIARKFNS